MTQETLDAYMDESMEPLPGITCADDWGPTMRMPIPEPPSELPDGRDARLLRGTGLAPEDFELLNGQMRPERAAEKGFHPDDQYREDQYEMEEDDPGIQEGLANQHICVSSTDAR